MSQWTDSHGPDKIYPKFMVQRVSTGEFLDRTKEFFFVLRPESDKEACGALLHYAAEVEHRSPELAGEIRRHIDKIIGENSA